MNRSENAKTIINWLDWKNNRRITSNLIAKQICWCYVRWSERIKIIVWGKDRREIITIQSNIWRYWWNFRKYTDLWWPEGCTCYTYTRIRLILLPLKMLHLLLAIHSYECLLVFVQLFWLWFNQNKRANGTNNYQSAHKKLL